MKCTMLAAACFLAATGASAQQPPQQDSQSPAMGERSGAESMVKATPSTQEFVKDVATSDLFEIASSRLAIDRGNAQSKNFASRMIHDHQKTTGELEGLIQSKTIGLTLPTELDAPHRRMLDKLKKHKGEDFDKLFGQDQIAGDKEAVSLFETYTKSGDNPDLIEWASATLPALHEHLQMAQALPH